ncbi:hypothetical protein U1Q18_038156 [Sarracenia purpurea var. burkii]
MLCLSEASCSRSDSWWVDFHISFCIMWDLLWAECHSVWFGLVVWSGRNWCGCSVRVSFYFFDFVLQISGISVLIDLSPSLSLPIYLMANYYFPRGKNNFLHMTFEPPNGPCLDRRTKRGTALDKNIWDPLCQIVSSGCLSRVRIMGLD